VTGLAAPPGQWVITNVVIHHPAPADAEPMATRTGSPRRIWPERLSVELFERTGDRPTRSINVSVSGVAALADDTRGTRRGIAHLRTDLSDAPAWVRLAAPSMIAEVEQEGRLLP
jgi:hypothetical protein